MKRDAKAASIGASKRSTPDISCSFMTSLPQLLQRDLDGGRFFALRPVLRQDPFMRREDTLRCFLVVDAAKFDEEADAAVDELLV